MRGGGQRAPATAVLAGDREHIKRSGRTLQYWLVFTDLLWRTGARRHQPTASRIAGIAGIAFLPHRCTLPRD